MPDIITVSATEARRNFFELFNQVYYGKKTVIVKKAKTGGRIKMTANLTDIISNGKIEDFIKMTYGFLASAKKTNWPYEDKNAVKRELKLQKKKLENWL